jgi:hypothetical protein
MTNIVSEEIGKICGKGQRLKTLVKSTNILSG